MWDLQLVTRMAANVPLIGLIERFMAEDHARIDRLLDVATRTEPIAPLGYARFRHDLLRHIAMEEKVLLPFARAKRGGVPLEVAGTLRADHGAIAKLLVRAPTIERVDALRELLARHNALEEGSDGLYATCDRLAAGDEAVEVVARMEKQPAVPLAPYDEGPLHPR